jgi:hypothetical protein
VARVDGIFEIFADRFLLPNRTVLEHKGFRCELWRLVSRLGAHCGSNGGIVGLLLTQAVMGIWNCFALLSGMEPTQMLPAREEIFKPSIIAHDAVENPSARAHDLGRQQNDGM